MIPMFFLTNVTYLKDNYKKWKETEKKKFIRKYKLNI
jgi:hypothetical protein